MNQYKIDLHTHSILSYDGGITSQGYTRLIANHTLDYIAITDHNDISFAQTMQKKLGNCIIIGEEITTTQGEIIGLFLKEAIPSGLSIQDTMKAILKQEGLVYIPHPFETLRKGVQEKELLTHIPSVSLIEVHNGRTLQKSKSPLAHQFAEKYHLAKIASSDAHGIQGIGYTYTKIKEPLTRANLISVLQTASFATSNPPIIAFFYPFINKIRKKLLSHHE